MTTATLWHQFESATTSEAAYHVSHAVWQAVFDDIKFRGTPVATVPRPISKTDVHAAIAWKVDLRAWLRTLPESLQAHFKQIETLTK